MLKSWIVVTAVCLSGLAIATTIGDFSFGAVVRYATGIIQGTTSLALFHSIS